LLLSVAVNVFFIAALSSRWIDARRAPEFSDRWIGSILADLPPDDARVLREAQRARSGDLAAARLQYRQALADAARAAELPDANRAGLEAALEQAGRSRHTITDLRVQLYLDALPRMSVEGRRRVIAGH
jgi:uncharacterized membrane protein